MKSYIRVTQGYHQHIAVHSDRFGAVTLYGLSAKVFVQHKNAPCYPCCFFVKQVRDMGMGQNLVPYVC